MEFPNEKVNQQKLRPEGILISRVPPTISPSYPEWEKTLVRDPEIMAGETVFPNSRLTVRRVAALLERGESESVILEDYPYLKSLDLGFAKIYCQKHSRVRNCQPN